MTLLLPGGKEYPERRLRENLALLRQLGDLPIQQIHIPHDRICVRICLRWRVFGSARCAGAFASSRRTCDVGVRLRGFPQHWRSPGCHDVRRTLAAGPSELSDRSCRLAEGSSPAAHYPSQGGRLERDHRSRIRWHPQRPCVRKSSKSGDAYLVWIPNTRICYPTNRQPVNTWKGQGCQCLGAYCSTKERKCRTIFRIRRY